MKPAVGLLLLLIGAGVYWWLTRPPPDVLPPPPEAFLFAPENCAFRVRIAGEPELASQARGELTIHTATVRLPERGSVRVSCGPYIVMDRKALLEHLPKQMALAARTAGLNEFDTDIRTEGDTLVAVYEGVRGSGDAARFVRSETRMQGNSFVELLWMVPPRQSSARALRDLARLEPAS